MSTATLQFHLLVWYNIIIHIHTQYIFFKYTYVPALQDKVQGIRNLAASLDLFSNVSQQCEVHNLVCGSSLEVLDIKYCAAFPFQHSNLQYKYYMFQIHKQVMECIHTITV